MIGSRPGGHRACQDNLHLSFNGLFDGLFRRKLRYRGSTCTTDVELSRQHPAHAATITRFEALDHIKRELIEFLELYPTPQPRLTAAIWSVMLHGQHSGLSTPVLLLHAFDPIPRLVMSGDICHWQRSSPQPPKLCQRGHQTCLHTMAVLCCT